MEREIENSVVVITGASSGIGKASAFEFAKKGANVVLAARRESALSEVANICEGYGVRALAVPTDVTDEQAVQKLAQLTVEQMGKIDVWVNNAGVTLVGEFEKSPPDLFRQVIETNLFGYIHGARAAITAFRKQGYGVLINNISITGIGAIPYMSAYVSSKFAIRGLTEALREELWNENNIHICAVMPSTIDTPLFRQAANFSGKEVKAMPPVYDAEEVARAIVSLAQKPKPEVIVGNYGRFHSMLHGIAPKIYERVESGIVRKELFTDKESAPSEGNLKSPSEEWKTVSGGWKNGNHKKNNLATIAKAGLIVAGGALLTRWLIQRRAYIQ